MKKLFLFAIVALALSACSYSVQERQVLLSNADFPCIVTSVTAKDTTTNKSSSGCFEITVKKANGSSNSFTTNESFAVGDTLTVQIDHSGAYEKTMTMVDAANAINDSTKAVIPVKTDSIATEVKDTSFTL